MRNPLLASILLVIAAATLWGTDSIVRFPVTSDIDPRLIVWLEHLAGLLSIAPFALSFGRNELSRIRPVDLLPVLVIGVMGASLGGLFSTESIQRLGPSAGTLFQMIQPIVVVALAWIILRERGAAKYFQCAIWVAFNYVLIAFSDQNLGMDFSDPDKLRDGSLYGLLSVLMWGLSTVAGKWLLQRFSPVVVVFLRFFVASAFMAGLIRAQGIPVDLSRLAQSQVLLPCLFLGAVTGSLGMLIYYTGLKRLPVSLVTFIELIYPVGGAVIPLAYAGNHLSLLQGIGIVSLVGALCLLISSEFELDDAALQPLA